MKASEALRELTDITASQWGMVTTAQAGTVGITRLVLSRLAEAGHLERLAHGVYKDAGAPSDEFEDLRAAWLSTEPKRFAEDRVTDGVNGVVVAGSSAAALHGIGDLWATRHEFLSRTRRQSQRDEIRFRQRQLDQQDVALIEGLPATTLERTLADLLEQTGDLSLVADALGDAAKKQPLDADRLSELFEPLAHKVGFDANNGIALLNHLTATAGLDLDSAARRISADSALTAKVIEKHLGSVQATTAKYDFAEITKALQALTPTVPDIEVQRIVDVFGPIIKHNEQLQEALATFRSLDLNHLYRPIVDTSTLTNIANLWPNYPTPRILQTKQNQAGTDQ